MRIKKFKKYKNGLTALECIMAFGTLLISSFAFQKSSRTLDVERSIITNFRDVKLNTAFMHVFRICLDVVFLKLPSVYIEAHAFSLSSSLHWLHPLPQPFSYHSPNVPLLFLYLNFLLSV